MQDALFAECKPVDKKHSLSENYCAVGSAHTGIERFVIGDYAWAMREAMMIAYVRDGFKVEPHLVDGLTNSKRYEALGSPSPPVLVEATEGFPLYQTRHNRRFKWKQNGKPATPIMLYHSWHDCE